MNRLLFWLIRWQALVALALAGVFWPWQGAEAALGVAAGGAIGALLTLQAGFRLLGQDASRNPRAVVSALYRGEARKFLLAVVLFGLVAALWPSRFLQVIVGYAATLPVFWAAMLRFK